MLPAIRSTLSSEWKRLVKYATVGTVLGTTAGAVGGYFIVHTDILEQINVEPKNVEQNSVEAGIGKKTDKDSGLSNFSVHPLLSNKEVMERIFADMKKNGIEKCVMYGTLGGFFNGIIWGMTRITIGVCFRAIKWVFTKRT
jgi:uncharacterized protein YneF (UPF0154 family)